MYGVKRGIKTPGDFRFFDMLGLMVAGAAGIIAAIIADFSQKGEAAALYKINEWVVQFGGVAGFTNIPLWMVVMGITAIGAGSVFYFQPITRQGAFAQGFGLLAVLLTLTPPNLGSGMEGFNDNLLTLDATTQEASLGATVINAAYQPGEAQIIQVQSERDQAAKFDLHLRINYPEGIDGDISSMIRKGTIRGRLHNESTGETFNLFRSSAGATLRREGDSLLFHAGVPARQANSRLWIRVETMGYRIETQSKTAALGQPVEWTIDMTPSDTPLFVQRLNESYWF